MSALTDAMAAAIATLKSQIGASGLTGDQVDAHIHAITDPLVTQITTIANSEADDASKIADIEAALDEFTQGFAPQGGGNGGTLPGGTPQQ
jgi:hypothetical protein